MHGVDRIAFQSLNNLVNLKIKNMIFTIYEIFAENAALLISISMNNHLDGECIS